ncbi:MAG: hypothetical protein KKA65_04620, partial [Nanoarchaeota archaeon]|nr:hypothetical protein [Nanoarchaeota archaeon]MCG2720342.1 hypothetical protein [Nanoarchaeota archaeon]
KSKEFTEPEIKKEFKSLEAVISDFDTTKTNITTTIFVHKDLKYFYDDVNNPDDDSLWIERIKDALLGFHIYEELGFNFAIQEVKLVDFYYPTEIIIENSLELRKEIRKIGSDFLKDNNINSMFNIFLLPPTSRTEFGFAILSGNFTFIYMNNSKIINQKVLAHEIGHLFGLTHANKFNKFENPSDNISITNQLLDPFLLFGHDVMIQGFFCPGYKLSEKDKEFLKFIKKTFK